MAAPIWRRFPCDRRQLRLDIVLACGQSFRWRESSPGEWLGVMANKVWRLKQDDTHIFYQVYEPASSGHDGTLADGTDGLDVKVRKTVVKNEQHTSQSGVKCANDSKEEHAATPAKRQRGSTRNKRLQPCDSVSESTQGNPSSSKVLSQSLDSKVTVKLENTGPNEWADTSADSHVSILRDYFQLDVDLESLYQQWCVSDTYFRKMAADFWGVRMLRQHPVENLFSFICSSNNHISRIGSMVEKLCDNYGSPIALVDGKMYHSFPSISSLAVSGVEERLRELGFGYRAKFIATSARYIMDNHGEEWVTSLRQCPYEEARAELMKLCGVGAKVADCVCLMSLDKPGALPVDTHVWQFAARHYLPKLQHAKSVTDKLYQEIGDYFRNLWGEYAGWAHSVLFTAELRHMQSKKSTPADIKVKRELPASEDDAVTSHTKSKRTKSSKPKIAATRSKLK